MATLIAVPVEKAMILQNGGFTEPPFNAIMMFLVLYQEHICFRFDNRLLIALIDFSMENLSVHFIREAKIFKQRFFNGVSQKNVIHLVSYKDHI